MMTTVGIISSAANAAPNDPSNAIERVDVETLMGWEADHQGHALSAFHKTCNALMAGQRPTTNRDRFEAFYRELIGLCERALAIDPDDLRAARAFFATEFRAVRSQSQSCSEGLLTGYFEPEVAASRVPDNVFRWPLLSAPDDLVPLTNETRPDGFPAHLTAARRTSDGTLVPYFDRAEIEEGALSDQDLAFVYLKDPVDAFFIHIQGSARLSLTDGTSLRVGYAGKNGHPFTAIGRLLVEADELSLASASMESIRQWLADHPDQAPALMRQNRSFIFFRQVTDIDPSGGPVGGSGVQLTAGRSLAIDYRLYPYGLPIWISADFSKPKATADLQSSRLTIAQDTGSAIRGTARADFFVGAGQSAGRVAGALRHPIDFVVLWPKALPLDNLAEGLCLAEHT